jgi:putative ABC transport system permease protein
VEAADEARLIVRNATSLMFPLPLSYGTKLSSVPEVKSVALANWFGGVYQDPKNFFAKFAVSPEEYFGMYPELGIPSEQYQAFLKDRKGCVVGKKLAAQYGFHVGDVIPIIGDIFPGTWEFNVHAIYQGTKPGTDETTMFFHWKYLDESRPPRQQGNVGFYIIQLSNPGAAGRIAKSIDADFENSPEQTLTETEKAFQIDFLRMMGNIEFLVRAIGGAVVFALVLVAANTMAMAARERTTEIAILKTIGFSGRLLGALVLSEALLLSLAGWGLGGVAAWGMTRWVERTFPTMFPVFPLKPETLALSLSVALLTGGIAGLFPALRAARTSVVAAMRKVA